MSELRVFDVTPDEWYPVYEVVEHRPNRDSWWDGHEVTLTDAEYADYLRVVAEFNAWQDRLAAPEDRL